MSETPDQKTRRLLWQCLDTLLPIIQLLEFRNGNDFVVTQLKINVYNPLSEAYERFDEAWYRAKHPEPPSEATPSTSDSERTENPPEETVENT